MDWATVAVRFALYLDLTALFGLPLFGLYALCRDEIASGIGARFVAIASALSALGIVLSLANLAVVAKTVTGVSEYAELDREVFETIVAGTDFGAAWSIRLVALALCLLVTLFVRQRPALQIGVLTAAGGVALSTLAWGGHGAMDDGVRHYVHLAADIGHLVAAGAWVGALIAFVLLARSASTPATLALLSRTSTGFARVGTLVVAALTATGVVNYLMTVGPTLPALSVTSYGGLLAIKLALFGMMLAIAATNRFILSPRLQRATVHGDAAAALGAFRLSLTLEAGTATLILALVATLGMLPPTGM